MLLVEPFYQFVLPPAPCLVYTVSAESINRTNVGPGEICFVSPRIRRIVVDTFRIFSLHLSLVVGLKKAVLLVFQYSAEHGREKIHGGRGGCSRFRHETLRFRMSAQKGEETLISEYDPVFACPGGRSLGNSCPVDTHVRRTICAWQEFQSIPGLDSRPSWRRA